MRSPGVGAFPALLPVATLVPCTDPGTRAELSKCLLDKEGSAGSAHRRDLTRKGRAELELGRGWAVHPAQGRGRTWGGAQGWSLAGGEHAEVRAGDTWPGRGGDRLCDGSTRSSVSQGKKGQSDC